ncbi:hypothetical protein OOU_Y34scaffold00174g66 [Pyricularia oryzae Y34]|uniref:Uncharacterized protein n=2 Tax=Pyricularia oryzae TaxID=318829 RepID=A0AA97P6R5_PYRO3|nr:hypothetical protein OOU_Y34scaffold00174g66 [Pyricularia oryzae Y34]
MPTAVSFAEVDIKLRSRQDPAQQSQPPRKGDPSNSTL